MLFPDGDRDTRPSDSLEAVLAERGVDQRLALCLAGDDDAFLLVAEGSRVRGSFGVGARWEDDCHAGRTHVAPFGGGFAEVQADLHVGQAERGS